MYNSPTKSLPDSKSWMRILPFTSSITSGWGAIVPTPICACRIDENKNNDKYKNLTIERLNRSNIDLYR